MKVKVRKRSLKENYQFLENKSKTISNTDIARYHDICNVMEIPISMLSDFIASNITSRQMDRMPFWFRPCGLGSTLLEIHQVQKVHIDDKSHYHFLRIQQGHYLILPELQLTFLFQKANLELLLFLL